MLFYFIILFILMNFPKHVDRTISIELSILYFKGLLVKSSIKLCINSVLEDFFYLKLANSADQDEMPPCATFLLCRSLFTWVKVFRIIPEFRILRLTFHRKSASKCNNSFTDLFSVCLWTFDHLNLKL